MDNLNSNTHNIAVNGAPHEIAAGATVSDLLASLSLNPSAVVVEVDLEVIPRHCHRQTELHAGAAVEIVHFVGGG